MRKWVGRCCKCVVSYKQNGKGENGIIISRDEDHSKITTIEIDYLA